MQHLDNNAFFIISLCVVLSRQSYTILINAIIL